MATSHDAMNVAADADQRDAIPCLLCRVRARLCALPVEQVVETLRPLPVEPLLTAPSFVRGLAIIRGAPVPVVDAAQLLDAGQTQPTRFVTVRVGERRVALAVDAVLGVRSIPPAALQDLPPLLQESGNAVVTAIGALDAELLVVLRGARLVPDAVWAALDR